MYTIRIQLSHFLFWIGDHLSERILDSKKWALLTPICRFLLWASIKLQGTAQEGPWEPLRDTDEQ
jgi:hypothetical protein